MIKGFLVLNLFAISAAIEEAAAAKVSRERERENDKRREREREGFRASSRTSCIEGGQDLRAVNFYIL